MELQDILAIQYDRWMGFSAGARLATLQVERIWVRVSGATTCSSLCADGLGPLIIYGCVVTPNLCNMCEQHLEKTK